MTTVEKIMLILILFAVLALTALLLVPRSQAQEPTVVNRASVAKCIVGEANYVHADRAPIAYTLKRRWQRRNPKRWSFARYCHEYCHSLHGKKKRSIEILTLPLGPQFRLEPWKMLWMWVKQWFAGRILDPCADAMNWGGPMDKPPRRSRVAYCGPTKNIFYADRRQEP